MFILLLHLSPSLLPLSLHPHPAPPFQGMPDYPPPPFVVDALIEATKNAPLHQYTRGMVSLLDFYTVYVLFKLIGAPQTGQCLGEAVQQGEWQRDRSND